MSASMLACFRFRTSDDAAHTVDYVAHADAAELICYDRAGTEVARHRVAADAPPPVAGRPFLARRASDGAEHRTARITEVLAVTDRRPR